MDKAEQEAEEILVEQGFIEPEELEPEMAELLREAVVEGKRACQRLLDWLKENE